MKCLAIADLFIKKNTMDLGLEKLRNNGIDVTVNQWTHSSIEKLQEDNLQIEQHGSEAVTLPVELYTSAQDAELVVTQFAPINKAVIDSLPKLKYIGVLRGGIENINVEYAKSKGIKVFNTPGRNARSVAEFTVGLMLSETRNIARAHDALKDKHWRKDFPNADVIPEIGGKIIGLVGFGHIAQLVAKFLSGFGCTILYYDKYVSDIAGFTKVETLEELVSQADIISLHARLSSETQNLINKKHFDLMKKTTTIINTARSGLINESDLIEALKNGRIMGAAIDTFDDEPLKDNSEFYLLDNITITPHMAGSTLDAFSNTPKLFSELFLKEIK
ncbi:MULTISPECIES: 2-hydroxyacid dehydrogenase [Providencia]|uniref:2-hydroxyacid dehydrogenase n=1 Tax=Providencia TaxID=586 RepID=UPI0005B3879D|nr:MULTISPECIES: 2-hydroxyacid dehydrogenase [Providencia]APC10792.1 Putative 2-hydroxyacid dehydrogenase YoaD [Providencia rettgeri]AVL74355.1 oxidoreductase [Providencia rettgeri]EJD6500685.1 2-hydroxyacid dehydrogenase [Providencia rettgeri]EJD6539620.1 2-hydroxyacid dehydrogenase [Providencia rettgeri]EJD6644355.1 2-hydroxyacid dehydrogenase [Providencia rettgeri]